MKSDHLLNNNHNNKKKSSTVYLRDHIHQTQKPQKNQPKLNICVLVRNLQSLEMKS